MNDDKPVISFIEQERLADPTKVGLALLINTYAWADAGMDEQVIAKTTAIVEGLQKLHMRLGNGIADHRDRFRAPRLNELRRFQAVAPEAISTAEFAPLADKVRVSSQDSQQNFFVVAEKKDGADVRMAVSSKALDHLRGLRTSIDQVTHKNQKRLAGRATR